MTTDTQAVGDTKRTPLSDGDEIDDKEMPLLEHLLELRTRLMYSSGALLVAFLACYFVAQPIFDFLVKPLADGTYGVLARGGTVGA